MQKRIRNKPLQFTALCLLLTLYCLLLSDAFAGTDLKTDLPVEIIADSLSYDRSSDTYYAEGNVVAVQGRTSVRADRMIVNMMTSRATATGNLEAVDEDGNIVKGDSLELDMGTNVGVVMNGRLFFKKGNVHVSGEEIKKTGEVSYSVHNASFTTCDCEEGESPAWSFYSREASVTFGEYLTGWNTFFYIKNLPVLYSPYVIFPVKRERETGFLFPMFGYSKLRGIKLDNSFFWAISDSTDATFYLDIETQRGLGEGIEYRYALSKNTEGEFYFYHFKERDINRIREFRKESGNLSRPETADADRWRFKYMHRGILPYDVALKADINRVSDDEYFIDSGKDINERSLESLESNISLTKTWGKFNLVTQFRYFDNLLSADDRNTLQRLPEVALTGAEQKATYTPFYFSLESSFVNFERKEGASGQRLDIHPTLSLPLNPGGYFEFKPSAGVRETFYWAKNPPYDGYADRSLYDVSADLTTTFVRIFSWAEGMEQADLSAMPTAQAGHVNVKANGNTVASVQKLKHTIRPKVVYTYIPEQVQDDLPLFDPIDRIVRRNDFTYSINSILTGKFVEGGQLSYRDYLYMDLSQSYNVNEATRRLISPDDRRRPFSDVTGEIRLTPFSWTLITAKGMYDVYEGWMNQYDASLGLWDKRGDRLDINYRYARSPVPTEYLDASLRFKVIRSLDLTYLNRYSYSDRKTLEASYGFEYQHQCWGAQLIYTERLEEKIVFLTFNLLGIGKVGGAGGMVE